MQTVNLTLMWWLGNGAPTPEVVVVYEALSPGKKALCRFALGPEGWAPRAEFDANGEWCGVVQYTTPDVPRLSLNEELPPPPSEIVVPVYAGIAPPARGDEGELVVDLTWDDKSEVKSEESEGSTKRRGPPAAVCPPEVEALLGTDKDTLIAAQTGYSVNLITKWRTEHGIPRYLKVSSVGGEVAEVTENVTYTPAPVSEVDATLAAIVACRFPDGASDEDLAQEAGVSVFKVVEARIALGLRRPRGRKPGVPQGPRKSKAADAAELAPAPAPVEEEQEEQAPTEVAGAPDDEQVQVLATPNGQVDTELDALLD